MVVSGGTSQSDHIVRNVRNVHFVDAVGSNYLFRGGLPKLRKTGVMNYNGLKNAIVAAAQQGGCNLPASFFLLDVNLLNIENDSDAKRIWVEYQFFKDHPNLGQIQVWGLNGTKLSATDPQLSGAREYLARNLDDWLGDRLAYRIETLRKWLKSSPVQFGAPSDMPMVIYVHCVVGCDRTGELIGAYYLHYMNKSWEEMNNLNQSFCPHQRLFNTKNYQATQWYCLWLNLERGFSLDWQKDFRNANCR